MGGDFDFRGLRSIPESFDPDAFGELYCRHERPIASFLMRRTASAEVAADAAAAWRTRRAGASGCVPPW
jgi:hypothetical protein